MLITNRSARTRRGFTLIEMLVSVVILGAMGIAFTNFLTMQNRFFERETNAKSARSIARNSMTLLMSDLRMVQDSGGVDSASSDGKVLRVFVPFRYGLYCGTSGLKSTVSMLPSDSATVCDGRLRRLRLARHDDRAVHDGRKLCGAGGGGFAGHLHRHCGRPGATAHGVPTAAAPATSWTSR